MLTKILLAFDGSDQSKRALQYALVLSEKFDSKLIILTVYNRPRLPVFSTEDDNVNDPVFEEYLEAMKKSSQNILDNAEDLVKRDWPSVNYDTLLEEGRPAAKIMSIAEKEDVDLVVVGSRGLGGVTGWVLGRTSRSVVDNSKKPVLVVK
jgi:nucleotide-binding universal stress UspA family protein